MFALRLMFEWGGGCVWCADQITRDRFGLGPIEDSLPISEETRGRLDELSEWHDRALDWSDPAGPSPWSEEEFDEFDAAALQLMRKLGTELGDEFDLRYVELGRRR